MIGGAGLGRGYLGRPDMTAEKFIPNPFAFEPGARVYKTGDSARHMPDGNVEFLGRLDHQVKIRGLRVELGEIEAAIAAHEGVREALVTLRQDETGDKRLVGYLVPCNGGLGDLSGLKDHLKKSLPQHMVPSAFVTLDQFPLTSNGKIDRKSLPPPAGVLRDGAGFVAPRNQIERSIANVWQQVLGIDRVGIHDNFFDLGGHSLLVIQSRAKLRSAINREVAITDLFQYPTVSSLARYLSGSGEDQLGLSRISARAGNRRTMTRRRRRSNSPIEDGQEPKNESISSPSLAWTPTNASLSEEREQVEGRNS
jgi:acyl carrier protein